MNATEIKTRAVPNCFLCGSAGEVLYSKMRDRNYSAPGEWSERRCSRPGCGLIWLDPQPVEEDIGKA